MKNYQFNAEQVKNECIQWIRDWFAVNGPDCNAVIGISGGKDSTIAAALLVEALGKDRVFGVMMPHGEQPDIDVSQEVIQYLGIDSTTINLFIPFRNIKHQIKAGLNDRWSRQSSINLAPRLRMSILYAVSQTINGRVVNTSNYSEDYVGYATRYGDTAGDFSPLSKLTVEEVKAIGYALGLPAKFIEKIPSDGLCSKTDEDNLGFTYQELDNLLRRNIKPEASKYAKIMELHRKNKFKLEPMPCFEPSFLKAS